MKTTLLVPLALLTRSAAIPTRKGERKWRRGIEYYRQHEKVEHAKHLRRRIKWIGALGVLAKGGVNYDDEEEAYDPAAYGMEAASYEDERHLTVNAGMSGSCPPGDVVTCVNGFATMVGGNATVGNVTCQEACAGGCCLGNGTANGFSPNFNNGDPINSCSGFNGKVCKSGDIPSCSDNRTSGDDLGRACYFANITEVVNGCNGRQACEAAGYNGGYLGRVVNSCHGGDFSCFIAAYEGYIKEIVDSCIGKDACGGAAADGGNISSITNGSCVGVESCALTASSGGFIGYINHGCRGYKTCSYAARGGSIGGISYACNNIRSCSVLASNYGDYGYDSVNSAVVSCCNDDSECTGSIVNASGLPDQCGTSSPNSSPTTNEPTGSPTTASPSSPPSINPSQQPTTEAPTVAPSTNPTVSPVLASPTSRPQVLTLAPTTSPIMLPETDAPTSSPSISGKSSGVASASGKSGKSSSAAPGVTKASKKSEASSKSSKSVKSAKAELPLESAEQDEVEGLEESIALSIVEVEEPKESVKLDIDVEEEDPVEVTEDEEVETEEEGLLYVLAKMLGGWW